MFPFTSSDFLFTSTFRLPPPSAARRRTQGSRSHAAKVGEYRAGHLRRPAGDHAFAERRGSCLCYNSNCDRITVGLVTLVSSLLFRHVPPNASVQPFTPSHCVFLLTLCPHPHSVSGSAPFPDPRSPLSSPLSSSALCSLQVDNIRRNVEAFAEELTKFRTTFRKDAPFDWREGLAGADSAYQVSVSRVMGEMSVWLFTSVV